MVFKSQVTLWPLYRGAAVFKGSSMEMVTLISSHLPLATFREMVQPFHRVIYGDGNVVYKLSSLISHVFTEKSSVISVNGTRDESL